MSPPVAWIRPPHPRSTSIGTRRSMRRARKDNAKVALLSVGKRRPVQDLDLLTRRGHARCRGSSAGWSERRCAVYSRAAWHGPDRFLVPQVPSSRFRGGRRRERREIAKVAKELGRGGRRSRRRRMSMSALILANGSAIERAPETASPLRRGAEWTAPPKRSLSRRMLAAPNAGWSRRSPRLFAIFRGDGFPAGTPGLVKCFVHQGPARDDGAAAGET